MEINSRIISLPQPMIGAAAITHAQWEDFRVRSFLRLTFGDKAYHTWEAAKRNFLLDVTDLITMDYPPALTGPVLQGFPVRLANPF